MKSSHRMNNKDMNRIRNILKLIRDNWNNDGKSNIRFVIYNLIYPAILGSMIYDLFNIRWNDFLCFYMKNLFIEPRYIMSISIVFFYLADYYYLYTFMNKEYTKEQKKERSYIYGDVLIAFCLLVAFKAYKYLPEISYISLLFIPILFILNSCRLEKTINKDCQTTSYKFDKRFALIFYLGGAIIYASGRFILFFANYSELTLAYFFLLMVVIYGIFVLCRKVSDKSKITTDIYKSKYKIDDIQSCDSLKKNGTILHGILGNPHIFVARHWKPLLVCAIMSFVFIVPMIVWFKLPWNTVHIKDVAQFVGIVVGAVGFMWTCWQIWTQNDHSRKQLAAEQFKNAIGHLGSTETTVIMGGIHALHDLATIDKSYRRQTLDILCSFIREETTKPDYMKLLYHKNRLKYCRYDPKYTPDIDTQKIAEMLADKNKRIVSTIVIQTIINLLFRQQKDRRVYFFPKEEKNYDQDYYRADLSEAILWDIEMWDADFRYVDFWRADLTARNCRGSDFRGARFRYAKLDAVKFREAKFSDVTRNSFEWINSNVTLLSAHTRNDTFYQFIQEYYINNNHLDYRAESLAPSIDSGQDWNQVMIDGVPVDTSDAIFEKVFTMNAQIGVLCAEKVGKLARELGYML